MNPLVKIVARHFADGDKPIQLFVDEPDADNPTDINVILEDGAKIPHQVHAKDRREFYHWHLKMSDWWHRITIGELTMVDIKVVLNEPK